LIAYRHGLRASELCELTWNMIELDSGRVHVRRAKHGLDSTHPLTGKASTAPAAAGESLLEGLIWRFLRGLGCTIKTCRRTGRLEKRNPMLAEVQSWSGAS
jgi:integrase